MANVARRVIVAGGGIGGVAAALVLARQGLAVEVLEQSDAFGEIGAGIQLGPNVFRMFEHLGLSEAIRQVAYFPPHLVMRDVRSGELVVESPVGERTRATYGQPYAVIYRADLHQVLLDACRALPSIGLHVKSKVTGFTQDAAGIEVAVGRRPAIARRRVDRRRWFMEPRARSHCRLRQAACLGP